MPTDWRGLLNQLQLHWVDRGPNARRGNVNCRCPFCPDDPSEHLQISEDNRGYFCLRNHRHSGTNMLWLLRNLAPSLSRPELVRLMNQHATTGPVSAMPQRTAVPTDLEIVWSRFKPAAESQRHIDYLHKRLFDAPEDLCRRYDLRYAPVGKWAMRLLIPIKADDGEIVSWTGRSLTSTIEPRYDMPKTDIHDLLYVPRPIRAVAVVVEGPLDALKIAAATEHSAISPISTLGTGISPARIMRIAKLIARCSHCYVCMDTTVPPSNFYETIFQLARAAAIGYIGRLRVPPQFDDAGEMLESEVVEWLSNLGM